MKWLDNLNNIVYGKPVGSCPHCGSCHTDYKCNIVVPEKRLGYIDIWCSECMRAEHISRMEITDDMKTTGDIPKGLKY